MNFKKLLDEGRIEKVEKSDPDFSLSERDLNSSEKMFKEEDFDWSFNIAYNSVLQAGRNFMFFRGYRPKGKEHPKNVFEFLRKTGFDESLVDYFDKLRKKRNLITYREALVISESEAKQTIDNAKRFVHKIRTYIHKIRTQNNPNKNKTRERKNIKKPKY